MSLAAAFTVQHAWSPTAVEPHVSLYLCFSLVCILQDFAVLLAVIDLFITGKKGHCAFKTLDRMHVKNVQRAQNYSSEYKACNGAYCRYCAVRKVYQLDTLLGPLSIYTHTQNKDKMTSLC